MDIFVGSLPFKLKEKDLIELFEKFGTVESAKIVIDKITRQNKGFGFVVMPDDKEALAAIKALDKSELMGRTIEVSKSEKKALKGEKPKQKMNEKEWRNRDWKPSKNKLDGVVTFDKPLKTIKKR